MAMHIVAGAAALLETANGECFISVLMVSIWLRDSFISCNVILIM
jgi:hypothetical protein